MKIGPRSVGVVPLVGVGGTDAMVLVVLSFQYIPGGMVLVSCVASELTATGWFSDVEAIPLLVVGVEQLESFRYTNAAMNNWDL